MARHETEFKLLLSSEEDVVALRTALPIGPDTDCRVVEQVNHFFDSPERVLGAARCALRLRSEDGSWTLTAKGPDLSLEQEEALSSRAEEECGIDAATARSILAGQSSPLEVLIEGRTIQHPGLPSVPPQVPPGGLLAEMRELCASHTLRHLGSFENRRTRIGPVNLASSAPPLELVFEFDHTRFPGGRVDRELEVEIPPQCAAAAAEALHALVERAGVAWRPATPKAARFFALALDPG